MQGKIETKSENSEKPKFPFQVEGIFGGVPDMGMRFQTWGYESPKWNSSLLDFRLSLDTDEIPPMLI